MPLLRGWAEQPGQGGVVAFHPGRVVVGVVAAPVAVYGAVGVGVQFRSAAGVAQGPGHCGGGGEQGAQEDESENGHRRNIGTCWCLPGIEPPGDGRLRCMPSPASPGPPEPEDPQEPEPQPGTAAGPDVRVYDSADRPMVQVLVDGQWHAGDLRMWTRRPDGWWGQVSWRRTVGESARLDTFPAAQIRLDETDYGAGRGTSSPG